MEMVQVETSSKAVITYVKEELATNLFTVSVLNGLFLAGLEKLLEVEFKCPCWPRWNQFVSLMYFLVPSFVLFVWKFHISGGEPCKPCSLRKCGMLVLKNLVWPMMWIVLLFMDGNYYVCLRTDWSGHLVKNDDLIPEKWCEPINTTLAAELEEKTRWWFTESQIIGVSIITGVFVILILSTIYLLVRHYCSDAKDVSEPGPRQLHQDRELSLLASTSPE